MIGIEGVGLASNGTARRRRDREETDMRVVLTGASGKLGAYLLDSLAKAGHHVSAWSGSDAGRRGEIDLRPVDLTDPDATDRALAEADPEVIIHAAALSEYEAVRRDPARARAVNVEATARLAAWCARGGRRLVFTSTDSVFDGTRSWYREEDPAEPIVAYGRTKREAERAVLETPGVLVARLPLLFGPSRSGRVVFFDRALARLRAGEPQTFFEDEFRTPLDYATAAAILVLLAEAGATGLIHVAGRERVSRFELMRRIAAASGIDPSLVRADRQADAPSPEPRPADVSLDTARLAATLPGLHRPTIEEAASSWGSSSRQ
jgi:dTDP-4-dehydrorhamnose reductase